MRKDVKLNRLSFNFLNAEGFFCIRPYAIQSRKLPSNIVELPIKQKLVTVIKFCMFCNFNFKTHCYKRRIYHLWIGFYHVTKNCQDKG